MPKLGRGRVAILWLVVAILSFVANGSAWRDLVSKPAGTIVHISVKGNELVPSLKALGLVAILVAIAALFANRLVISLLSALAVVIAAVAFLGTIGKLGAGHPQIGVSVHVFALPAAGGLVGALGAVVLAVITALSARGWPIARYRGGEKKPEVTPLDLWKAQDAGIDPTAMDA